MSFKIIVDSCCDLTPAQQEAMSRYLEQELGIPSQGQIFDSEEVP